VGIRCPNHVALTSPRSGGRSVGIVRSRTKATELYVFGWDVTGSIWLGSYRPIIPAPEFGAFGRMRRGV
jgi:hypothetical protein